MPLLPFWMVTAVGIFVTSAAFVSFTGNRDAFHVHPTLQMWTVSDGRITNGRRSFMLFGQSWKNSRFGAVSTNVSKSDLGYGVGHGQLVSCWEVNESRHLESCQVGNRKGKPSSILKFF